MLSAEDAVTAGKNFFSARRRRPARGEDRMRGEAIEVPDELNGSVLLLYRFHC
jgi:hypothetical protein